MRRLLPLCLCALLLLACGTDIKTETIATRNPNERAWPTPSTPALTPHLTDVIRWRAADWLHSVTRWNEAIAVASKQREQRPVVSPSTRAKPPSASAPGQSGTGRCGGNLPPCWVMNRESGGDLTAQNPQSTASGKWQALDSTWNGYGGYSRAMYAPESVQDEFARQLWNGGRGCNHWAAC